MAADEGKTHLSGASLQGSQATPGGKRFILLLSRFRPAEPLDGPLKLKVTAYMPIPASWSKKRALAAMTGSIQHTSKPDLDNLVKHLKDCMSTKARKGVVIRRGFWIDDRQVVDLVADKRYDDGRGPRWAVEITPVESVKEAANAGQ